MRRADRLFDIVLEDAKVLLGQTRQEMADPIAGRHGNAYQRGAEVNDIGAPFALGSLDDIGVCADGRGAVRELSLKVLRVPHFGQLTREIWPRLLTDVTT